MDAEKVLSELNAYIEEGGFFFEFRYGKFDEKAYEKVLKTLNNIDFTSDLIRKDIVAEIWDLPFFLYRRLSCTGELNPRTPVRIL